MKINTSPSSDDLTPDFGSGKSARSSFQLKKVLVPVDFSTCSKKALQYAVPFARQFNARLLFLHVVPFHFHGVTPGHSDPASVVDLKADAEGRLATLAQKLVPARIPVEIHALHGVEAAEIVNCAKKWDVDIIILSTHGRIGRARSLAGSVTEDIVRLAPCPVLVVREHQHEFIHNQICLTAA